MTLENFIIDGLMCAIVFMLVDFNNLTLNRTASLIVAGMLCGLLLRLLFTKSSEGLGKYGTKKNEANGLSRH
jgi:hypothetical protein